MNSKLSNIFVSFNTALKLKELGFNEPCLAYWYNETPKNKEGQCLVYYKKPWDNIKIINSIITEYYSAPTYEQACDFLETLGYFIELKIDGYKDEQCVDSENICYRAFVWKVGQPKPNDDLGALRYKKDVYEKIVFKYIFNDLGR